MSKAKRFRKQLEICKMAGGTFTTGRAIHLGIHPRDLYGMRAEGLLEQVGRGVFRIATMPPLSKPDLTLIALKIPKGVICLISALAFHEITTQIPHEVYVALKRPSMQPRIEHPPAHFIWLSEPMFSSGIETHIVDGVPLRVYSPEKTVADCFRFRNRIGLDVALEALKLWRARRDSQVSTLMKCAKLCRVQSVIKPYLEAIL